jgi:Ca2+-binding EF-hand superfamily protein
MRCQPHEEKGHAMKISGSEWNAQDAAQRQQDVFKKIDADGDGKVTKDELKTFLSSKSGGANSPAGAPSIDDIFSRIDTNGDGTIDESENASFMQSMKSHHHHHQQQQQQGTYTQSGTLSVSTPADSKPLGDA